jgi:hypothetical protein
MISFAIYATLRAKTNIKTRSAFQATPRHLDGQHISISFEIDAAGMTIGAHRSDYDC